jgi:hypothetical protein
MKTDDLISMLATGTGAVDAGVLRRRFAAALGAGLLGSSLILVFLLGINREMSHIAAVPMFWIKLGYCAALAAAALAVAARLARPGARIGGRAAALAAPLLAMWLLALFALPGVTPAGREALIFGGTWLACPFNIAFVSLPLFAVLLWAMRGLAPTRPVLAGAAAGLLSGAVAATLYCLHCPELGAPFLGIWYPLGMLIPAAAGAMAGHHILRW